MGIGGYLSTKAERDNYRYLLRQTQQLVERSCTRALEEEIFKILSPYGLSSTDSKRIVSKSQRCRSDSLWHCQWKRRTDKVSAKVWRRRGAYLDGEIIR